MSDNVRYNKVLRITLTGVNMVKIIPSWFGVQMRSLNSIVKRIDNIEDSQIIRNI